MATAAPFIDRRPITGAPPVRVRKVLAVAGAIVLLVAIITVSPALAVLLTLAVLTPWIIARPLRGLHVLLGAAIVIEIFWLAFPDSITDRIPFFMNLNNSLGVPVSVTPAELLMGLVLVLAFVRSDAAARARLFKGRLFWPYVLFVATVLLGEVHGLYSGGDWNKSLWEVRPQIYGFVTFVAASLIIRSRRDLEALVLVAVVAIMLKGIVGDVRYFIVLNHNLGTHETVLGHEDSYFLALIPMAACAALIWMGTSRVLKVLVLCSIVAMGALLANERRAGVAALAGGIAVIVVTAIRFHPHHRRRIVLLTLIGAILIAIFLIAFWDVQTGLIGQLVRPVRSQFDPTYRDYLSDIYRQAENANLRFSFDTNRLIGMGFGMPFLIILSQADISSIYPLWNYIPHNTLMWVGVRLGLVGSATFWALFGFALLEVCRSLSAQRDRFLLALVALIGGAITAQLFVAYADLQLESYRNMIFIGIVFGVLNILPALFPEPTTEKRRFA